MGAGTLARPFHRERALSRARAVAAWERENTRAREKKSGGGGGQTRRERESCAEDKEGREERDTITSCTRRASGRALGDNVTRGVVFYFKLPLFCLNSFFFFFFEG